MLCAMATKKGDISSWAVGGGLMLGLGVGFFFLTTNVFAFVGCILAGIGLGLVIAPMLSCKK